MRVLLGPGKAGHHFFLRFLHPGPGGALDRFPRLEVLVDGEEVLDLQQQIVPDVADVADVIAPVVESYRAEGMDITGPVPADTVYVKALAGQFDAVVAMYHDQGHIAVKTLGFVMDPDSGRMSALSGVNVTLGLPIVRTSVDHGTALALAGTGRARPDSLFAAVELALELENVPAPPAGHHYEVWVLRTEGGGEMEAVGSFTPDGERTRLDLPLPGPGDYQAVDISVEPDGGPPEHSSVSLAGGRFGS